jgi:hypothetical protein
LTKSTCGWFAIQMAEIDHASPKVGSVRRPESLHGTAKQRFWSCGLRKVPFDRIAEALGMTKGAANKAFYRPLRGIPEAFADQVRKEELESRLV